MAFVATSASDSSRARRAFSLGPLKVQFLTYTAASGDTSGTITADQLIEASFVMVDGKIQQTSAATFSGNQVTLAFADPLATIAGDIMVFGV